LLIAAGGVLAAMIACGVGHHAFGWDLEAWLRWLPACGFRSVTGIPCPGCGMTRAFLLLSQLRVGEALSANPASPGLVAAMATWLVRPPGWSPRTRDIACVVALAAVLLAWGSRCLFPAFGLRLSL
jgi:hypothetical protein